MQYGSSRERRWRNKVLRFLDGQEQSFRLTSSPLRRWVVRAELLDEGELTNLLQFFEEQQCGASTFSFTDPDDGTTYPSCCFEGAGEQSAVTLLWSGEQRGAVELVIREIRS